MRRAVSLVAVLAGLTGCAQDRQLQQDLLDYKNETTLTLMLLEDQNDFLMDKLDTVSEAVDAVDESDSRLQRNFSAYSRRPDEIKQEILDEVDTRAGVVEEQQERFAAESARKLDELDQSLDTHLSDAVAVMQASLDHEDSFFRFVFGLQDSVNLEFAQRFDRKPWYESVIGRWEAEQKKSSGVP